jgi:hypothetical protein
VNTQHATHQKYISHVTSSPQNYPTRADSPVPSMSHQPQSHTTGRLRIREEGKIHPKKITLQSLACRAACGKHRLKTPMPSQVVAILFFIQLRIYPTLASYCRAESLCVCSTERSEREGNQLGDGDMGLPISNTLDHDQDWNAVWQSHINGRYEVERPFLRMPNPALVSFLS